MKIILFLLLAIPLVIPTCPPKYADRAIAYDDKVISQSVMWTVNNLTKSECLDQCYKDKFCVSFHFYPPGPTCVALRDRFTDGEVSTSAETGYTLFRTRKRELI